MSEENVDFHILNDVKHKTRESYQHFMFLIISYLLKFYSLHVIGFQAVDRGLGELFLLSWLSADRRTEQKLNEKIGKNQ